MVLSLATAGTSAGSLLLVPLASSLIEAANWRVTWLVLGAIVIFLALPVVLFIVKDSPEEVGELPDGEKASESPGLRGVPAAKSPLEAEYWLDAFRSKPIWQLSGAYFVCGVTTIIISTHYVPFALDRGVSPQLAASAFGLMMGLNAVGVVVIGFLSTKFSRKKLLGTVYFVRFLAYMMLVFGPNAIGIWGFAVLAGLSWIATPPLTASLTTDIYGLKNIGTLNGISTLSHQIGGSISVLMAACCTTVYPAWRFRLVHKLDPRRLRVTVPAGRSHASGSYAGELLGQGVQVLGAVSADQDDSCRGVLRRW